MSVHKSRSFHRGGDNVGPGIAYKIVPEENQWTYKEIAHPEVLLSQKALNALQELQKKVDNRFYLQWYAVRDLPSEIVKELSESRVFYRYICGNSRRHGLRKNLLPFVFPFGTTFLLSEEEEEKLLGKCREVQSRPDRPIKPEQFEGEIQGLIALVHKGKLIAKRELKDNRTRFYIPEKGD